MAQVNVMNQRRVRIYEQGPASVLRYEALAPLPSPDNGQVLLRQEAIGLNFVDTMFRDGSFGVSLPFDMGVEAAGVIEAVGRDVQGFAPGDRVAYFFVPGAYASRRLMDPAALIKLPDGISTLQAAALLAKGLTAWMAVKRAHELKAGETVYVNGASGGVGLLVALWASQLGATVIAAVGSAEKADAVRQYGLQHVVVTGAPAFDSEVRAITGGKGVDVVYEFVGGATFAQSAGLVRQGGSLLHIGNASGAAEVDHGALAARRIRYLQPATPGYVHTAAALKAASDDLFNAVRHGVFGALDIARYPLADVVRAHEDIAARRHAALSVLIP